MQKKARAVRRKTVKTESVKAKTKIAKPALETVIDCGERLDIFEIENFYTRLQQAKDAGNPIVFDAAHIQRIDTAALQVLVAFFSEASSSSLKLTWRTPSEVLCQSARLLGILKELALPDASGSTHSVHSVEVSA